MTIPTTAGVTLYVLLMNSVRGAAEDRAPVAAFTSMGKGVAWEQAQRAEATYMHDPRMPDGYGRIHPYRLAYKEGSLLMWFNPLEEGGRWAKVFIKESELNEWLGNHDFPLDPE